MFVQPSAATPLDPAVVEEGTVAVHLRVHPFELNDGTRHTAGRNVRVNLSTLGPLDTVVGPQNLNKSEVAYGHFEHFQ